MGKWRFFCWLPNLGCWDSVSTAESLGICQRVALAMTPQFLSCFLLLHAMRYPSLERNLAAWLVSIQLAIGCSGDSPEDSWGKLYIIKRPILKNFILNSPRSCLTLLFLALLSNSLNNKIRNLGTKSRCSLHETGIKMSH